MENRINIETKLKYKYAYLILSIIAMTTINLIWQNSFILKHAFYFNTVYIKSTPTIMSSKILYNLHYCYMIIISFVMIWANSNIYEIINNKFMVGLTSTLLIGMPIIIEMQIDGLSRLPNKYMYLPTLVSLTFLMSIITFGKNYLENRLEERF